MSHTARPLSWDIFCNVIDNYGDIGVSWRLARQLCHEYGHTVRLWVDDLRPFARLCPEIHLDLARQHHRDIEILHWCATLPDDVQPGDVVVDAFGAAPPEEFLAAMAEARPAPVWINLEYLTAENWVDCCHGMASPHPRYDITRYFFFPGFNTHTGGIIAERGIASLAHQWQHHPLQINQFLHSLGLPAHHPEALYISLFAYENAAIGELLHHWAASPQPIVCLVPEGRILGNITASFAGQPLSAGDVLQSGALSVYILPFSDQERYDRLLWSCDINFVRGEDSFIRAQLAGKPLVWHIYPQEEAAHWTKLDAFCQRYSQGMAPDTRQALQTFYHAWNRSQALIPAWEQFITHRHALENHAAQWPRTLLQDGDLVTRLMRFIAAQRQSQGA